MISTLKPALARLRPPGGLPPGVVRSLGPLLTLAVGVTLLVLMFLWRDQSTYKPVFGSREKVPAAEMMTVLDAEGVRYRIHPDSGQVLVAESELGRVRMLLAAKGVVAKLPGGLELMDRNDPLGVSQFVQDVRFRRGLEGELAQSIMSFDAVESARVHLSIAKSSSFVVADGEKSSASVALQLKPGRTLSAEQIAATIKLVAGSVASLDPQRISVVDQAGHLLSARVDLADGLDAVAGAGSEAGRRYADEARRNVRDLLSPVLGDDNYKTTVSAEVDNDRIQETRETYGATPKVTNEAMRQEMERDGVAVGVPGSLSNRPVAVAASQPADAGTASKNATTRQYAYDRNITQIQRSRGRLAKLNVAVVLNAAAAPSGKGTWTADEIAGVEKLLKSGLGIHAERGDTLVVSAMPFPAPVVPAPWWQQRDNVVDITTYVGYALAALLGFFLVVRPLLKLAQHRWGAPETAALTPLPAAKAGKAAKAATAGALPAPAGAVAALPQPAAEAAGPAAAAIAQAQAAAGQPAELSVQPLLENVDLPPPGSPVDVLVDHLKVLAAKEPERVAEVVKQWVQKNDRNDEDA